MIFRIQFIMRDDAETFEDWNLTHLQPIASLQYYNVWICIQTEYLIQETQIQFPSKQFCSLSKALSNLSSGADVVQGLIHKVHTREP